ncbi:hypothetical protein EV363DRAFT_111397 [Boletus edulis]|uniref:Uncharacterized protein n=1 Tax=Boletus edulis BED1 TaxID=1328754 RepID=A0AAD4BZJ3_BOLED|nr:hypothetical protein EV363DRAFT_111397 [Boletus edulis]KAF8444027.1 hypothetical protein L210DRAFT_595615 [Boletus edulis BED1]
MVCKLTAWRDTADAWRGLGPSPGLKRGNIVYFESTSSIPIVLMVHRTATWETGSTVTLTASPYNRPIAEICYRRYPIHTKTMIPAWAQATLS